MYLERLSSVGKNVLPKKETEDTADPKKKKKGDGKRISYSFYKYGKITGGLSKPEKKDKYSPGIIRKVPKPSSVKKPGKKEDITKEYIELAQGRFPSLVKDSAIIEKLHDKITEMNKVMKTMDEVKEEFSKQIEELGHENEVLERENVRCKRMLDDYMTDPDNFDLDYFESIVPVGDKRTNFPKKKPKRAGIERKSICAPLEVQKFNKSPASSTNFRERRTLVGPSLALVNMLRNRIVEDPEVKKLIEENHKEAN